MRHSKSLAADRLLLGSPLRQRRYAIAVIVTLALVLAFAAVMQLRSIGRLKPDVAQVFFTALGASSAASLIPLVILWFLDRRVHVA